MREAEKLVAAGVKELLVISQDTSAYGTDLKYSSSRWKDGEVRAKFLDLARELGEFDVCGRGKRTALASTDAAPAGDFAKAPEAQNRWTRKGHHRLKSDQAEQRDAARAMHRKLMGRFMSEAIARCGSAKLLR